MVGKRNYNRGGAHYYNRSGGGNGGYGQSGNGYNYSSYNQGYRQEQQLNPWSNPVQENQQQLDAMALELEVMKRKRQMLQQQRQLLQEERELRKLQNESGEQWKDSKYGIKKDWSTIADMYRGEAKERRAPKRSAPPPHSESPPAKKPALSKPQKEDIISQVERDVGPVDIASANVFTGADTMTPVTRGRLEYSLGHIVRSMREAYQADPNNFPLGHYQMKALKEAIRKRLYAIMMNKTVDSSEVVMKMYRKVHPVEKDVQLLEEVLSWYLKTVKEEPADASVKSEETLVSIAVPVGGGRRAKQKQRKQIIKSEEQVSGEMKRLVRVTLSNLLNNKMDVIFTELNKVFKEKGDVLFAKPEEQDQSSGQEATKEPAETTETIDVDAEAKQNQPETAAPKDDAESKQVIEIKDDNESEVDKAAKMFDIALASKVDNSLKDYVSKREDFQFILKELRPMMEQYIEMRIPELFPRYKDHFISLLSRAPELKELGLKAVERLPEAARNLEIYPKLYYVKILGRPSLPPRDLMTRFFKCYNVITVKKHHSMFNLLFVGLPSEEQAENLIRNNGVMIGGKKLIIKQAPDRANPNSVAGAEAKPGGDGGEKECHDTSVEITDADTSVVDLVDEGATEEAGAKLAEDINNDIDQLISCINEASDDQKGAATQPETTSVGEAPVAQEAPKPVEQESSQKPVEQESSQKPLEQESSQKPLEQESSQKPVDQESSQKPVEQVSPEKAADNKESEPAQIKTRRSTRLTQN